MILKNIGPRDSSVLTPGQFTCTHVLLTFTHVVDGVESLQTCKDAFGI